jgi:hypothetical protein
MAESKRGYSKLPSFEETAAFVDEELRDMEARIVLEEAAWEHATVTFGDVWGWAERRAVDAALRGSYRELGHWLLNPLRCSHLGREAGTIAGLRILGQHRGTRSRPKLHIADRRAKAPIHDAASEDLPLIRRILSLKYDTDYDRNNPGKRTRLSTKIRERAMEVTAARNPGVSEEALANYLKRGKRRRP